MFAPYISAGRSLTQDPPSTPLHPQAARAFADMHDTPVRMLAKGVIRGIVPWAQSRRFFATRLRRRLAEEMLVNHIHTTDASMSRWAGAACVGVL